MVSLYGIATCDTCRKARRWLAEHGIDYHWHDLRRDGLESDRLERWLAALGWERLLNRRGRSWRELPADQRAGLERTKVSALLLRQPLLIKRPVLEAGEAVLAGFDAGEWRALLERQGDG